MAWDFSGAASEYLSMASAAVTSFPLTISAWIKPDDTSTLSPIFGIGQGTGSNYYVALEAIGVLGGDPIRATSRSSSSITASSGAYSAGAWQHVLMSCLDEDNIIVGLDATETTASGSIADFSYAWAVTTIGTYPKNTAAYNFHGLIAEVAVWNTQLTRGQRDALARGFSPDCFPGGLAFYWRGDDRLIDRVSGSTLTNNNSVAHAGDHPPMIYPRRAWAPTPAAAATGSPWYYYAQQQIGAA